MLNMLLFTALAFAGDAPAKSDTPKESRWTQGTETIRNDLIASPRRLCEVGKVREEVKITPKQWEELIRLKAERYKQASAFNLNQRMANVDESIAAPIYRQRAEENRQLEAREIRQVLDAKQVKRLTQIYLQVFDMFALADPEFQEVFNLGPEQRDEIVTIREQFRNLLKSNIGEEVAMEYQFSGSKAKVTPEERQVYLQQKSQDFERHFKQANNAREAALREISRHLTKRQRESFQKMKGDPLDLSRLAEPGAADRINAEEEKSKEAKKK